MSGFLNNFLMKVDKYFMKKKKENCIIIISIDLFLLVFIIIRQILYVEMWFIF